MEIRPRFSDREVGFFIFIAEYPASHKLLKNARMIEFQILPSTAEGALRHPHTLATSRPY